ncbi:MAG: 50S ribosomal protein L4 [Mycoplasmataceae bacterium]|nr:50S ribosomal protein L4 [Mycoplasmataceae bacterium]
MKITVYNQAWKENWESSLNKEIFWIEPNNDLMHRLLVLQRANARYNLAKTLTKWWVRWWWRKPYRQKWTWRARQGSTRNPHYIWGWVAHWPTWERNFTLQMPKKMRRKALFSYLSVKTEKKAIFWLEWFKWEKTKEFADLVSKLPIERNLLVVVSEKASAKNIFKVANNIENVKVILASYLNPVDLTKYRNICFVWDALENLEKTFLRK